MFTFLINTKRFKKLFLYISNIFILVIILIIISNIFLLMIISSVFKWSVSFFLHWTSSFLFFLFVFGLRGSRGWWLESFFTLILHLSNLLIELFKLPLLDLFYSCLLLFIFWVILLALLLLLILLLLLLF